VPSSTTEIAIQQIAKLRVNTIN